MVNRQPRTHLDVLVQAAHLSVADFVVRFHRTAVDIGEPMHVSERQAKRWLAGESGMPRGAACRVLEHWWGEPIRQLLGPPRTVGAPRPPVALSSDSGVAKMEDVIEMAADRARTFGVLAQATSAEAVALIHDEVRELARAYPRRSLSELLSRLIEVQDTAFRLLESPGRPADARELYVLSGLACGMLAKASHDLGEPHAAMTQSRTAYICAEQAGHTGLQGWVRGLQALISYWAGRPAESVRFAQHGTELAGDSAGWTRVWLPISEARAWARQGATEPAMAAIHRAESAAQAARPGDLDEIGGLCSFGAARLAYYAADGLAWLPEADRSIEYAERAVEAYSDPAGAEWAFGDQAGSHTALAVGRIRRSEFDGAAEAMTAVLALPGEHRIHGVMASALRVRAALPPTGAADLAEQIELFTRTPIAALPR